MRCMSPELPLSRHGRSDQCPLCADIVEKVESSRAPKISRMSNVRDLRRSKAIQNRCERRWSVLRSLMWSLTSLRVRRTSGPENFWSYGKRDFFNNIRQKRSFTKGQLLNDAVERIFWWQHRPIPDFCPIPASTRCALINWADVSVSGIFCQPRRWRGN